MFDNNEDDLYLFMEYAPEGDLNSLLEQAKEKKKFISENMIWNIILQLASGISDNIQGCNICISTIFCTGTLSLQIFLEVAKLISWQT